MSDTTLVEHRRARAAALGTPALRSGVARGAHPVMLVLRDLAIVVLATLVPLVALFRLWDGDLGVPFVYFGDANFYGGVAQNIIETGWYQETNRLGAPLGQEMYDFPLGGDNFHWVVMRSLGAFTSDWAVVVNVFYLLTFFASSISAYFCLRWLGGSRVLCLVAAVLFSFAPYHFLRYGHLVYASYAILPIGVVFAVRAARGRHPFTGVANRRARAWLPVVGWVVLAALIGSCNAYYAVFSVLMIATAAILSSVVNRSLRPLVAGAITVVVIAAAFGANVAPSLWYERQNGTNELVAERRPAELDAYGLRVSQLLTPVPGHRVGSLATLSEELRETPYNSEQSMFLGLLGSVALLGMLGSMLVRTVRRRAPADEADAVSEEPTGLGVDGRGLLTVFTVLAILVGVTGGLSWFFFVVVGFEDLRAWNRVSVLILFLVLAWLVLTVDRVRPWQRIMHTSRFLAVGLACLVLAAGIADQSSAAIVPDRRDVVAEFTADGQYFTQLEEQLPRGALVFQLPYMSYPEVPPIEDMIVYDPLRPYLHTNDLKWSYGGMRGRESDWQAVTGSKPASEIVDDAIAAGFSGVLVDRFGYADKGAQVTVELRDLTGDDGTDSADGRWIFFDLSEPITRYENSTTPSQREQRRAEVLAQRP